MQSNQPDTAEYNGTDLEAMIFAKNYHNWIIDSFTPYLGNTIAEVGAGTGNITRILSGKGEHVFAFEPSVKMASILSGRLQHDNKITTVNSTFSNAADSYTDSFDSIVYINVLEHIQDDQTELNLAYRSLKQDGYICIFVPALEWLYSEFDRSIGHYRRYHLQPLCRSVMSSGFTIVRSGYLDMFGILPWWIMMVLLKRGLNPASTSLYDKLCIPAIRRIESRIRIPIGKNIILVAQKRAG